MAQVREKAFKELSERVESLEKLIDTLQIEIKFLKSKQITSTNKRHEK